MADLPLKLLLRGKTGAGAALEMLLGSVGHGLTLEDTAGNLLVGSRNGDIGSRIALRIGKEDLGWVSGPDPVAQSVAALMKHLVDKESERRALAAEVLHLYREVHLIDQLSEELAALLDIDAVAESALAQARRLIAGTSGGILVRDAADGKARFAAMFGEPDSLPSAASGFGDGVMESGVGEILNPSEMLEGFVGGPDGPKFRSLVCAPLRAKQRTVGLIVLTEESGLAYSARDLKLLNTIALQTAAAVESALLCAEMVESTRDREQLAAIQKELDTARAIQTSLLPRVFPPFPERTDFDLHAQMTPAKAVGGDFFDYFLIDEDHLGIVVGDVSGKGTPAALYMAVTHTHVRSTAVRGMGPGECLAQVNKTLLQDKASSMFATCFYAILNTKTGELRYSSAGHNPSYVLGTEGKVRALPSIGGTPLGLFPWTEYQAATEKLEPGESLFLYTDGVPEAENVAGVDFSDEQLIEVLKEAGSLPSQMLIDRVHAKLDRFTTGAPQTDDITMVVVRRPIS